MEKEEKGVAAPARVQNVWMDKKAEELQQPGQANGSTDTQDKPVVFLPVTVT
jgi:hypothetical protein